MDLRRENQREKQLYVAYVFLLLILGMIFWFSAQQGGSSHGMSQRVCEEIVDFIDEHGKLELTEKQVMRFTNYLDQPIRKLAHIAEYAVLGAVLYMIVSCYTEKTWKRVVVILALLAVAGGADEIHQMYIVARDGKWQDVVVDVCGGGIGMMMGRGMRRI